MTTMHRLDNIKLIRKLDSQGMLSSIESLALQCQQAWDDVKKIKIPRSYRNVDSILINGMGGSALGGHIIGSLYDNQLTKPLRVINSYTLPRYLNNRTLYIVSSYSGTTEEPVSTFREARKRGAKIIIIGSGGALAKFARRYNVPAYIFTPQFNPSNQPRMGLGYSIVGQFALLKKAGIIKITDAEIQKIIKLIVGLHAKLGMKQPMSRNPAKRIAQQIYGHFPVYVAAEHLSGNAHVFANQTNENGKTFSAYFLISEMNHHLMEGMRFPKTNVKTMQFVFLESKKYLQKIQKRFGITRKVLAKNSISYSSYKLSSGDKLAQAFEALVLSSYVSFYLAVLNTIDPSPIPYVDFFKSQLKK